MRIYTLVGVYFVIFSSAIFAYPTIVTYNIANYNDHPNWSQRADQLAAAIEKVHPDIILLQEVRFDPDEPSSKLSYQNTAEQLLQKLNTLGDFIGATITTQPIMYYPINTTNYVSPAVLASDGNSHLWEGISIISKLPVIQTGTIFLNNLGCQDFNKRATQFIKVLDNNQPYYIVNVHFTFMEDCLGSNIKETLDLVNQWDTHIPVIIAGDMNAEPTDPSLQAFTDAGFVDTWQSLHPNDNGYSYPSDDPTKRIDYIWLRPGINQPTTTPIDIEQIGMEALNNIYPSDHLGLALGLSNAIRR